MKKKNAAHVLILSTLSDPPHSCDHAEWLFPCHLQSFMRRKLYIQVPDKQDSWSPVRAGYPSVVAFSLRWSVKWMSNDADAC